MNTDPKSQNNESGLKPQPELLSTGNNPVEIENLFDNDNDIPEFYGPDFWDGFGLGCPSRAVFPTPSKWVDVSHLATLNGFRRMPVFVTKTVWEKCIKVPAGVVLQYEPGRMRRVSDALYLAYKAYPGAGFLTFEVLVRNSDIEPGEVITLKAWCDCIGQDKLALKIGFPKEI